MEFAVIIPVYNAEKYINEAVESVINQTFNFLEHIEIILVDDGSTDQSSLICQEFKNKYPDNIQYIRCENSGPAYARNIGLDAVSKHTKYIAFLDSDDHLSTDALEEVYNFFMEYHEVQLAVLPLYHFERIDAPHRLNYRFVKGNRIINIYDEYDAIHFHIGGCIFRADHFSNENKLRFNQELKFWEDALLINSFLLDQKIYGVVSKPKYFYRKRYDENSLVNNAWYEKSRYTEMIEQCYTVLVSKSLELNKVIIPYVQFLIIYHLRLYLLPKNNDIIYEVLNADEQEEFFQSVVKLIQKFNKRFIKKQNMPFYYKSYLINLKNYGWPYKEKTKKIHEEKVNITSVKYRGLKLLMEGDFINKYYMMKENDRLFITYSNKIVYLQRRKLPPKLRVIWGTTVRNYENAGFTVLIPLFRFNFQFGIELGNGKQYLLNKVNFFNLLTKS